MTGDFPAYDPPADHGGPTATGAQRLSYPTLAAMERADPYEVAAVVLRATFQSPETGRVRVDDVAVGDMLAGVERSLRTPAHGLLDALTDHRPPPLRRVQARTLAIWRNALVAEVLPIRPNVPPLLVLLEPEVPTWPDDRLVARLRGTPARPEETLR